VWFSTGCINSSSSVIIRPIHLIGRTKCMAQQFDRMKKWRYVYHTAPLSKISGIFKWVSQNCEKQLSASLCACVSSRNNSTYSKRIFIRCDTGILLENMSRKLQYIGNSQNKIDLSHSQINLKRSKLDFVIWTESATEHAGTFTCKYMQLQTMSCYG
jgi:hypothetical protein